MVANTMGVGNAGTRLAFVHLPLRRYTTNPSGSHRQTVLNKRIARPLAGRFLSGARDL